MDSIILYGSETSSVKEEDVVRLERIDANVVRNICCNIIPENRISTVGLNNRLKIKPLNTLREHLHNTQTGKNYLERIENNSWPSEYQKFKVRGSLAR